MSRIVLRSFSLAASATLVAIAACSDATSPIERAPASLPSLASQPSKGVWTVTSLDDPGVGSCTSASCTLRQAVAAAQDGDRIVFKTSLSGTVALSGSQIHIGHRITIDGGGKITIDGGNASRIFGIGEGEATLSGLTFTRGFAPTGAGGGGAILNGFATVTISNSAFVDNHADVGGAIISYGVLNIVNTSFSENSAERGGAIYTEGDLSVVRSTLSANSATAGGGIFIDNDLSRATIAQSTISGNRALQGGGVGGSRGSLSLRSATLTSNFATLVGGGISYGGRLSAANSILGGNFSSGISDDCDSPGFGPISYGHNVSTGCFSSPDDIVVSAAQFFTEVIEPTLKNNGGPTMTHALIERGRAVDAGYCPGETVDQRGFARPYDDTRMANAVDACDIGAFEWRPPVVPKGSK